MESPVVIGFWGGMALLISSITGPGLTTIPLLFQQAGWFTPTLAFLVFGAIAAAVSLFLVETMSAIRGNEAFQSRVEYATVAHLYLGNRPHLIMQLLLYCALQSVNLSSIIISEQTMDSLLITLFHKTCAISFTQGPICVSTVNPSGSPFDSYVLASLGYLISAALVIPLSMMTLVQNIKFQLASAATLFIIMIVWVVIFAEHGLNQEIPAFGSNQSSLVGFVLNNFAFITTVPSFVNELSRKVSIHRVVIYSITICVTVYLIVGITGAASFKTEGSSDILATLAALDRYKALTVMVNILFPISVLVTSVPVFAIVIRYNLVRGNICSERYAQLWASWLPWLLIIPFQTKGWLLLVMNWSSLIFGSSTNFIIPLLFYLSSKSHSARTANATGALAPGDVFFLYEDSSSRRSTHIVQRERDPIPSIVTTVADDGSSLTQDVAAPPVLSVYPPSLTRQESLNDTDASKDFAEDAYLGNQDISGSSLDPSSIPLRVVYSPAVSRSGSVTQTDRPSILLSRHGSSDNTQIIRTDSAESGSRIRSNSFEVRPQQDSTMHRRNLSRNNSAESTVVLPSPTENSIAARPSTILGSSNRRRRLTIEEVAEESDENRNDITVFKAFPETRFWNSIVIAKIALGIVTVAVLGNLVYTIVETAKGESPLGS